MVKRNLTRDHQFVCFTEDHKGLDPEIQTMDLPPMGLDGPQKAWWYKLKVFDSSLPLEGTLLFLDLDVVITSNIDALFDYCPGKFCIIQDFLRVKDPSHNVKNSSVFRLEAGSHPEVWEDFSKFQDQITKGFHGDQDWISARITDATLWPHDWIISYRWELKKTLDPDPKNHISFSQETPPPKDCCIVVFHGDPSPKDLIESSNPDPLVLKFWK